jgi:flagellin
VGIRINSNIPALNAGRQARNANSILQDSLQRLGSGLRINRAGDDASGLAIAERFNTLARQSQREIGNLQSGVSAVQTAEGGLDSQTQAVQRLRELAVQASNGTLNDQQRDAINAEAQQLLGQIDETAEGTQFNGTQLLNGSTPNIELGTEGGATLSLPTSTTSSLGISGLDLSTQGGAAGALEQLDAALNQLGQSQASLGAQQNRFESAITTREEQQQNALASESAIRDLDVAREAVNRSRGQILLQGSLSALIQSNVTPQSALNLLGT